MPARTLLWGLGALGVIAATYLLWPAAPDIKKRPEQAMQLGVTMGPEGDPGEPRSTTNHAVAAHADATDPNVATSTRDALEGKAAAIAEERRALAQAYAAADAASALKSLLGVMESDATRTIERGLEDLCFERTGRNAGSRSSNGGDANDGDPPRTPSWRQTMEQRRRDYCTSMKPVVGDDAAYQAALAAHGPDSYDETSRALRQETAKPTRVAKAERILARSTDFAAMLAAAMILDQERALGVPPHSHDAQRPASLGPILADALGWVSCTEFQACGPQSGNTIALCRYSNDCPPDADYPTALRMMHSATRFEQLQWLYQRILALRRG